ncbi:hypothetical protein P7C70_g493, partial [Phenoliferia sp. Uapishka_3]
MMSLINALTASGASLELDVPRIAIIGNQSAGKSSLVEAISGIAVPRDDGTCTRTPYEVQLKSSDLAWSCKISIRTIVDQDGEEHPPVQVAFGPTLVDPAQVEPMLRKAQLAILNPGTEASFFVKLDRPSVERIINGELPPGSKKQLSFSKNLVVVEIEGPDAVDLTFIDLPGIISNVKPGDDKGDIELVRNLAVRHITGNCLILCAFSMKDDLENQSAGQLAKEADPTGTRTIGVLTKADTLQDGEHSRWLKVLRGEVHQLSLGYFCTKLRGTADLKSGGTTYEASRAAEASFFTNVSPWDSLKGEIRHRLGTKSLVNFLGDRLSLFMASKIPELISKTSSQLADIHAKIGKLPPPPSSDPVIQLESLIAEFVTSLQSYAAGASGCKKLIQDVGDILDSFKLDIQATEPRFVPFISGEKKRDEWEEEVVAISSSDKGRNAGTALVESRKKRLEELGNEISGLRNEDFVLKMDLDQVHSQIKRSAISFSLSYSFPTLTASGASKRIWSPSLFKAGLSSLPPVSSVYAQSFMRRFIKLSRTISQGSTKGLYARWCVAFSTCLSAHLDQLFDQCRKDLNYLVSLEKTTTTRNVHFHTSTYHNLVRMFNAARKKAPSKDLIDALVSAATGEGEHISREDVIKMLNGQEYAEEIDVMASVQAYWKVRSPTRYSPIPCTLLQLVSELSYEQRIIDNIPRAIDAGIVQRLHENTRQLLVTKVGLYAPDARERAIKLVSEKCSITKEREELVGRTKRLEEARELLSGFDEQKSA